MVAAHQLKSGDIQIFSSTTAEAAQLKQNSGWVKSLGEHATKALFVVHITLTLIGMCVTIVTNSHATAISTTAKKVDSMRCQARENCRDLGRVPKWFTMGLILSGLSTAWSLGMVMGPAFANKMHFSNQDSWSRFCSCLGGLCVLSGVASWYSWRDW